MKLYTVTEVAAILKVHRETILRWIAEGKINAFKVGKEWRIDEKDLQEFIERGV